MRHCDLDAGLVVKIKLPFIDITGHDYRCYQPRVLREAAASVPPPQHRDRHRDHRQQRLLRLPRRHSQSVLHRLQEALRQEERIRRQEVGTESKFLSKILPTCLHFIYMMISILSQILRMF